MENKKKIWITVAAVIAAVIGAVVAVAAFMKKKAQAIGEQLDYDAELIDGEEELEEETEEPAEEPAEELDVPEEGTEAL